MFGKSTIEWNVPYSMARSGAPAASRTRGRDAAAHRHLTMALFPVFLPVVMARRVLRAGMAQPGVRHSILHEAWSSASTASTFAFLG